MDDLFATQKPQGNDGGTVSGEAGFEEFWKLYPKKVAKGDARKAWQQVAKIRPPLSTLLKAVVVAKACEQWRRDGGAFIPYPATWLRGERWEDCHEVDLGLVRDGKAWNETVSGIEAQAAKLGMEWTGEHDGRPETFQQFSKRVQAAFDSMKVIPINRAA